MKKQDIYKLLAAFMILVMIIVPVAYVITNPRSEFTQQEPEQEQQQEKYNPELWVINQPFNSISDALMMTPYGADVAYYVDIEGMTPQMAQWVRANGLQLINEVDSIYKSNTTKMYYARLNVSKNESFLLLSTMFPEKNDFEYIELPNTPLPILMRQDKNYSGTYNILGNPAIFAPPQTAIDVLRIISSLNKTVTSYDQYEGLLEKIEPAPFQTINSNTSFANQFYLGIAERNGNYERTTAYLNINSTTLKRLKQLEANSTQKGFMQYNITTDGNYTTVRIVSPELAGVLTEETS